MIGSPVTTWKCQHEVASAWPYYRPVPGQSWWRRLLTGTTHITWHWNCGKCGAEMEPVFQEKVKAHLVAIVLLGTMAIAACGPCHTKHDEVVYHPAYRSCTTSCAVSDPATGNCWAYDTECETIPARCTVHTTCDLRCKVLDKGKTEAHDRHATLVTPTIKDSRCQ